MNYNQNMNNNFLSLDDCGLLSLCVAILCGLTFQQQKYLYVDTNIHTWSVEPSTTPPKLMFVEQLLGFLGRVDTFKKTSVGLCCCCCCCYPKTFQMIARHHRACDGYQSSSTFFGTFLWMHGGSTCLRAYVPTYLPGLTPMSTQSWCDESVAIVSLEINGY